MLDAFGIAEVQCENVEQRAEGLVGFAKDGYPLYGPHEDGAVPADLDSCQGHSHATTEFPDGVYHYHALETEAPNLPTCIRGNYVRDAMTYR